MPSSLAYYTTQRLHNDRHCQRGILIQDKFLFDVNNKEFYETRHTEQQQLLFESYLPLTQFSNLRLANKLHYCYLHFPIYLEGTFMMRKQPSSQQLYYFGALFQIASLAFTLRISWSKKMGSASLLCFFLSKFLVKVDQILLGTYRSNYSGYIRQQVFLVYLLRIFEVCIGKEKHKSEIELKKENLLLFIYYYYFQLDPRNRYL